MNEDALRLSKSKIQILNDCGWKYKLKFIDNMEERDTPYSQYRDSGYNFHLDVVNYFQQKPLVGGYDLAFWDNFLKFEKLVLQGNKPIIQEQKIYDVELDFTGIVDAIFINQKDNEYIIMDWKTGNSKDHNFIREELAYYKIVIDRSKILDKPVKYWAMFFVKDGVLFFEEVKQEFIDNAYNLINQTRNKIKNEEFIKNFNHCKFCGFFIIYSGCCEGGLKSLTHFLVK